MQAISKLLSTDGFIQVNKTLIKLLGLHEAIIIGELCSEYNYWEAQGKLIDGMFYSTRENIEENTGLNEHYQRKAMKHLQELGLLIVEKKGVPATNYYKVVEDKLLTLLSSSAPRDRELDLNDVNLNNNKQTKITNKEKSNSKELLQNFEFGRTKPQKESLYSQCVSLTIEFVMKHDCEVTVKQKLIEYLNYRVSVKDKPLYANMWKGMLNKLQQLHEQGHSYIDIIDFCLERGYLSFYPISSYNNSKNDNDDRFCERGVTSSRYTKEELEELERIDRERERNGLRTKF